ncbi:hypothetical protein ACL02S_23475 [Nocardia sp. 004]|uniref:hypothetical protein n=1 Tax=Nocardia sp. 004 TaxID=3385978 RepID=UPI0039A1F0B5
MTGRQQHAATTLTDHQVTQLRQQAATRARGPIDPAQLRRVEEFMPGRSAWASAILGRPFPGIRGMSVPELVLLDLAAHTEPTPPPPRPTPTRSPRETAAAARVEAVAAAWMTLAQKLPVKVGVAYNYSGPRHLETYLSGADHIILLEPLYTGRLHRSENTALCCTPSRSRKLQFNPPDTPDKRTPTCKACLRTAYRIARTDPDPVLLALPSKQVTRHRAGYTTEEGSNSLEEIGYIDVTVDAVPADIARDRSEGTDSGLSAAALTVQPATTVLSTAVESPTPTSSSDSGPVCDAGV